MINSLSQLLFSLSIHTKKNWNVYGNQDPDNSERHGGHLVKPGCLYLTFGSLVYTHNIYKQLTLFCSNSVFERWFDAVEFKRTIFKFLRSLTEKQEVVKTFPAGMCKSLTYNSEILTKNQTFCMQRKKKSSGLSIRKRFRSL